jgi:hypothetical protein
LQALADLLVGEVLAALDGFIATVHGFDEAAFFLEIAREDILQDLVGRHEVGIYLAVRSRLGTFVITGMGPVLPP